MIIETPRLGLREMTKDDLPSLRAILQDATTMAAYEGPFDDAMVDDWLARMLLRYRTDGFGLWAVVLGESGEMIGQCGLTRQQIPDREVLEVGYLFNRQHWHQGYALEAASACRDHGFNSLITAEIFSIIRDSNIASMNVAIRLGMTVRDRFVKHYRGIDMPHLVFSVTRTP